MDNDSKLGIGSDCEVQLNLGLRYNFYFQLLHLGKKPGVQLSHREIQCMILLSDSHPYGVLREAFLREIWGSQNRKTRALDMHLLKLRKKLEVLGFELRREENRFFIIGPKLLRVLEAPGDSSGTPPDPTRKGP